MAERGKRVYLTLSEETLEELEDWAEQQGRPIANLASYLVEKSIEHAKESGEFKPKKKQTKSEDASEPELAEQRDRAQTFIQTILGQQSIDIYALGKLAADLDVDTKTLGALLKKHNGKVKNGN